MKALNLRRRKSQGMTEYIVLVGIVALLMIAAVTRFGFAVDEAIQGSANAFLLHHPAEDYPAGHTMRLGQVTFGNPPVSREVRARVDASSGTNQWVKEVVSPGGSAVPYNESTHGRINSGNLGG